MTDRHLEDIVARVPRMEREFDHFRASALFRIGKGMQDWTPALTGATTNPNLGSTGLAEGRFCVNRGLVYAKFKFTFGGTSISAGSGQWFVSYPVPPAGNINEQIGHARYQITGFGSWGPIEYEDSVEAQLVFYRTGAALNDPISALGVTSTNASGVAAGNIVSGWLLYESA